MYLDVKDSFLRSKLDIQKAGNDITPRVNSVQNDPALLRVHHSVNYVKRRAPALSESVAEEFCSCVWPTQLGESENHGCQTQTRNRWSGPQPRGQPA